MNVSIVKIGGSLLGSPDLDAWLSTIAGWAVPVVIVPGGGPFAETVRATQRTIGFDDRTAHRLALLAMEQVAVLLAARAPNFVLAASHTEMNAASACGRIPVWLPSAMVLSASDVPASWDVTSDSLAVWLAGVLGAPRLLLVKSRDVESPATLRALVDARIVDPLFPSFAERSRVDVFVAGPGSLVRDGDLLRASALPGVQVGV